jgi:hypothetical protein
MQFVGREASHHRRAAEQRYGRAPSCREPSASGRQHDRVGSACLCWPNQVRSFGFPKRDRMPAERTSMRQQFAGVAPVSAAGRSDLVLRNVNTGAFQAYNIAFNSLTGSASLGAVGLDWQLGGLGATGGSSGGPFNSQPAAMDGSTSQLVQAMAGFGGSSSRGPSLSRISRCAGLSVRPATSTQSLAWSSYNLILACNDTFASLKCGEQTRRTVRRQHTCVRRGAASVKSRRYHKNLLSRNGPPNGVPSGPSWHADSWPSPCLISRKCLDESPPRSSVLMRSSMSRRCS